MRGVLVDVPVDVLAKVPDRLEAHRLVVAVAAGEGAHQRLEATVRVGFAMRVPRVEVGGGWTAASERRLNEGPLPEGDGVWVVI